MLAICCPLLPSVALRASGRQVGLATGAQDDRPLSHSTEYSTSRLVFAHAITTDAGESACAMMRMVTSWGATRLGHAARPTGSPGYEKTQKVAPHG